MPMRHDFAINFKALYLLYFSGKYAIITAGTAEFDEGGQTYETKLFYWHPKYDGHLDYDVGIIKTSKAMTLDGKTTKAIALPDAGVAVVPGTDLFVSGWGRERVSCKIIVFCVLKQP
jgi:hypothetical protein